MSGKSSRHFKKRGRVKSGHIRLEFIPSPSQPTSPVPVPGDTSLGSPPDSNRWQKPSKFACQQSLKRNLFVGRQPCRAVGKQPSRVTSLWLWLNRLSWGRARMQWRWATRGAQAQWIITCWTWVSYILSRPEALLGQPNHLVSMDRKSKAWCRFLWAL